MPYIPTIGLEIHAELKTRTKMFCACLNESGEKHPNLNVCPVCLGHPGTLPVANKEAVLSVIKLGLALGGKIAANSHFDRKSYFYPDLPKAYQISQYENPLVQGGLLNGIRIRRVHLEEDTGRLSHVIKGSPAPGSKQERYSLVDFNRAGVPLMELVTEPEVKTAMEAVSFAKELQKILRYLDVSDGDMEKGEMRVEANVSLDMGTKVELKNINSFRAVHDAIEYEIKRQEQVLKEGGRVVQETRGWNEKKGISESQRSKESAHDYRYFTEPDLPPLDLSIFDLPKIAKGLPELPEAKKHRFIQEFGLSSAIAGMITEEKVSADYFEEAATELKIKSPVTDYQLLINYFTSDLKGLLNEGKEGISGLRISPENFAHLVSLVEKGELSSRLAKDLLARMFESGEDPETLIKASGTRLVTDEKELEKIAEKIISENPQAVADYKKGKGNALQFFLGKAMAATKGKGEPGLLRKLLLKKLS